MDDNPYAAPQADTGAVGVLSGQREDLRSVAKYQKGILVCILLYLIAVIFQFALPPEAMLVLIVGAVLVLVAGTSFVFLLAMKVYGTGVGILLGLLTLIPLVGLIVLLRVNAKATSVLQQNGIKVGLLGADLTKA
jgi:hypothetical protein